MVDMAVVDTDGLMECVLGAPDETTDDNMHVPVLIPSARKGSSVIMGSIHMHARLQDGVFLVVPDDNNITVYAGVSMCDAP
jgi:hypothetical protein